ncbi:MAG: hypothetical protein Kow001_24080 [Acidobacteriota bacterium]
MPLLMTVLAFGSGSATAKDITCKSENYRYRHCKADTSGGVRLKKVKSRAPCIQNETWGWDRRGIWVDKGCEAEFELGDDWDWQQPDSGDRRVLDLAREAVRERIRQDLGPGTPVEFGSAKATEVDRRLQRVDGSGRLRGRRGGWEDFDYRVQVDTRRWVVADLDWRYSRDGDRGIDPGRLVFEARIDDEVDLVIQGRRLEVKEVSGRRTESVHYVFDSPLPRREVVVQVRKLEGRGTVTVREQPSRRNDYRAIITVSDRKGGTDRYKLEITW